MPVSTLTVSNLTSSLGAGQRGAFELHSLTQVPAEAAHDPRMDGCLGETAEPPRYGGDEFMDRAQGVLAVIELPKLEPAGVARGTQELPNDVFVPASRCWLTRPMGTMPPQ